MTARSPTFSSSRDLKTVWCCRVRFRFFLHRFFLNSSTSTMKIVHLPLLLLTVSSLKIPSNPLKKHFSTNRCRLVRPSTQMLVTPSGSDAFAEIRLQGSTSAKFLEKLPSPLPRVALASMVPAAAAATFAVVPANVPLKLATSYVASILGTAGRRRLVPKQDEAVSGVVKGKQLRLRQPNAPLRNSLHSKFHPQYP